MNLEAILPLHTVVPSWTLPDRGGQPFSLFKPRGRAHTLLMVAGPDVDAGGYLSEVAPHLEELRVLPARGVAVLAMELPVAVAPWTMLRDSDGHVRRLYLPGEAQVGVFILDRYNDLYHQWIGPDSHALPPVADVVEWLEAVGRQCSI